MKYVLIAAAILIAAALAAWFWVGDRGFEREAEEDTAQQVYMSDEYGFSFEVPEDLEYLAYTPEAIAVGVSTTDGFVSVANVRLSSAGEESGYEQFDDFLFGTLRTMCAADGPSVTISCDSIESREPFESFSGAAGEEIYLSRMYKHTATKDRAQDRLGPIFVFEISEILPEMHFAMLTVEPPMNIPEAEIPSAFVRKLAASVSLAVAAVQDGSERILVLVTDARTEADQTVVVFDSVEWLQGEEAVLAAAEDTECTVENAEECVPSLYNNFYIRNTRAESSMYPVASGARIVLSEEARSVERTIGDLSQKLETFTVPLPFHITIENGRVIELEEMYLP